MPEQVVFVFDVAGVETAFGGYTVGEEWVARAKIGSIYVTLTGQPFDPADVVLERVADIEPYILAPGASISATNERRGSGYLPVALKCM